MSERTKGPWYAVRPEHAGGWWVVSRDPEGHDCVDDSHDGGFERDTALLIASAPEQHELLETFTTWARQVASREDVPRRIRSAAAELADDGRRLLAKAEGRS